jgi:transposase
MRTAKTNSWNLTAPRARKRATVPLILSYATYRQEKGAAMASPLSVLKTVIPLNLVHVESWETVTRTIERYGEAFEVDEIRVHARPFRREQCRCPKCMRKCEKDGHRREGESAWRAPDLDGVPVYLMYRPQRIKCPEHGEINERLPWADGESRFTAGFNDEAAWLACQMSRTSVSCFLGINWRTVGNCVKAAHDRIEPDVAARVHCGLRAICVDEL